MIENTINELKTYPEAERYIAECKLNPNFKKAVAGYINDDFRNNKFTVVVSYYAPDNKIEQVEKKFEL